MKKKLHICKAGVASLLGVLGACDATLPPLPNHPKGYYSKETLGDLPEKPKVQGVSDVISLVQGGGMTPEYRTKVATEIRAGDKMSCNLKAGEIVSAIGDAGNFFLVHAEKSSLTAPCANSGDADFVEGYVDKSNLEVFSPPPTETQAQAPASTGTTSKVETSTTTGNSCSSVKYGSKVVDGKNNPINIFASLFSGKSKKNLIPGQLWRQGGEQFFLQVAGQAETWKVQAFDKTKNRTMPAKIIDAATLEKGKNNEVILPFQKFVEDPNNWVGVNIQVVITPRTKAGVEGATTCVQEIALMSPLVLDFSGGKIIETKAVSSARVLFDIDADGQAEQTGWIDGRSSAFLVLDLNRNGIIDNGSEMFGDSTRLNRTNKNAAEGFAALAQYDTNGDGKIDSDDPVFRKLKLWFDRNGNGKTDVGELETLTSRRVDSISLHYSSVPRQLALQHPQGIPNDVRTSAVFAAKGCPSSGCQLYDVFFGSVKSRTVTQK